MAEKTVLFEAEIDTDKVTNEIKALKQSLALLREESEKVKKTNGETSKEYIEYEAAIKQTNDEIRENERLLKKQIETQTTELGTLKKLENENAALRKEQKSLNLETKEGIKRNQEINKKLNENNDFISANSDKLKQNKMQVGDYARSLDDMAGGFVNSTKAALKFIATPIGAIIAAIVVVVTAVVKAFKRSEDSMNKLKQVTGALSGAFSGLMNMLKPVVNFIADSVIVVFETLAKVADKAMQLVSKGLRSLGFEGAANAVDNFTQKLKESTQAGIELAKMEAELQKAQRQSEKIQLDYQKRAEKIRQQRDDESKSVAERIKLNNDLGRVLKEQLNEELKIANLALKIAEKRVQLDGESTSNLDALAEAQTRVADIQERITGQESEQLANLNSLRREAMALAEEARQKDLADFEAFSKSIDADVKESNDSMRKIIEDGNQLLADSIATMNQEITKENEINAQREMERIQLDYETQQQLAEDNIFAKLDFELNALKDKRAQEIYYANQIGADVQAINDKYDKAELALERAKMQAKLSLAADFFKNVETIAGEGTAVAKAAAVAETTVNTYKAATGSYSALASIPYVGPVLGIAAAAAAVAAGIANVKKILSVKSGLKGDKSSGSASISAGGGVSAPRTTSAPTVGQGIVARNTAQTVDSNNIALQPTLVTDQVTVNQRSDLAKNKTAVA